MHIHHNPMASGNPGIHSASAAEKAAAAQRAAETRRKLLRSAAQIKGGVDGTVDAGEIFMIGKWSHDHTGGGAKQFHHKQQSSQQEDEGSEAKPTSMWA